MILAPFTLSNASSRLAANPVTDCFGIGRKIAKALGRSEGIYFLADRLRLVFKHDDGKTYFIEIREAGQ